MCLGQGLPFLCSIYFLAMALGLSSVSTPQTCNTVTPIPQADMCRAYQIMHRQGILDEQIVVMMYDDIADNPE